MTENIKLEVVTPEKAVVNETVQIVMAPGTLGEFGVLRGHTPFLTTLKIGSICYKDQQGKEYYVFVSGGFAEALPDKITVLAESAERRRHINLERAKAAKQRAMERLEAKQRKEEIDLVKAKAALERAIWRIKLASGG